MGKKEEKGENCTIRDEAKVEWGFLLFSSCTTCECRGTGQGMRFVHLLRSKEGIIMFRGDTVDLYSCHIHALCA